MVLVLCACSYVYEEAAQYLPNPSHFQTVGNLSQLAVLDPNPAWSMTSLAGVQSRVGREGGIECNAKNAPRLSGQWPQTPKLPS